MNSLVILIVLFTPAVVASDCLNNYDALLSSVRNGCTRDEACLSLNLTAPNNFSEVLWKHGELEIAALRASCFIYGLQNCSLARETLEQYAIQDIHYLKEASIGWGIAAKHSEASEAMKNLFMENERKYREDYLKGLLKKFPEIGANVTKVNQSVQSPACKNYTDALNGYASQHPLVFAAANLPCHWIWGVLGSCINPSAEQNCPGSYIHNWTSMMFDYKVDKPKLAQLIDAHSAGVEESVKDAMKKAYKESIHLEFALFNEKIRDAGVMPKCGV